MKWGKKKRCSSSPSKPFLISQVLPTSWLTKFKQMSLNDKHEKVKQKGKWNYVSVNPSSYVNTSGGGKFYGKDGDGFWRISFGEEDGVFRSVRRNSGYDFDGLSNSSFRSKDVKFNGNNDMVSQVKKMKEVEIFPSQMREKVAEIRTPRLRVDKEKKVKKESFQETEKIPRKSVVKNVYEMKGNDDLYEENLSYEWQKLKERKIEEVKSRNEEQRKSLYISRDLPKKKVKQNSKVRVSSPRTSLKAEVCKIKAIEDMKKAKLKMKKKAKDISGDGGFQGLESFAVVKCSYDPEGDFRNSMIEMIKEQNISQPEQLEELLACYLTLNSDEYHDLIIRVFRQVWFILNQDCFYGELENNNKI